MMHKYQIDKVRAIFRSKVTEARYFESIREETIPEVRKAFVLGLSIFWLYSILDFLLLSKNESIQIILVKLLPTITTVLLIYFLSKIEKYQTFYLSILLNLFILLSTAVFAFMDQKTDPMQMTLTQLIFIMGVTLLIPNTFVYSMMISIASSLIFIVIDLNTRQVTTADTLIIIATFSAFNIFIFQFDRKTQIVRRLKFRELVKEQKYIRVLNKEILKRTELEKRLTEMACMDSLTGACNRRYFIDIAEHEKRKNLRVKDSLSIMLIDIDDFKIINDTYGHATGDKALRKFMKVCKSTLRSSDVIGRMGGEEFAVLCTQSNKQQTIEIANRLCKNIAEQTARFNYHFTISIGVSDVKSEHRSVDKALHLADLALYEAKREGKNQVKSS